MSLINCPECGTQVSDRAEKCPKCAYPINDKNQAGKENPIPNVIVKPKEGCFLQSMNAGCLVIAVIIGIIILFVIIVSVWG